MIDTKMHLQQETKSGATVFVPYPSKRYIDEFLRLKCAPDLMAAGMFPNAKEITESMTAFNAVRQLLGHKAFHDRSISLLDVGCGVEPRTAALFACRTRWETCAVDPLLRREGYHKKIRRVDQIPKRIENGSITSPRLIVITAVHAHVNLEVVLRAVVAPEIIIIAMPCCQPLELPYSKPPHEYEDFGCWSPKRRRSPRVEAHTFRSRKQ